MAPLKTAWPPRGPDDQGPALLGLENQAPPYQPEKEALWWQPGQASPATYNWLSAPSILTSPPDNHHGRTDKGLLAKIPLISTFKTCIYLNNF